MTVIVFDGRTLAADKLACYGNTCNAVTKIARHGNLLMGGAGEFAFVQAMFEWVRSGRAVESFPKSQSDKDDWQPLLVIEADGSPSLYERTPYPVRYEQKVAAIGSGKEFARAALWCGKSAREAVECANALCSDCGLGVDTLDWIEP